MKKHSVVLKLFVVTSLMILIAFALVMLAEGLFFERFYRMSKINALERSMNQFALQYQQAEDNEREASRALGAFMNLHDASVAILNNRFERTSMNPYFLALRTDSKTVTALIPMEGITLEDIPPGISLHDTITIDGIYMDEKDTVMHPVAFYRDGSQPELQDGLTRVDGEVIDLLLPEHRSFNPLYQDSLIDQMLRDWMPSADLEQSRLQSGSLARIEWQDAWSGVPYTVLVRSLSESASGDRYLIVMTSMQPVGEAVHILKQYVIYLAPVILAITLILSLIYSRMVSKPLMILNRSVSHLAKLDFSDETEIRSRDEFGELSRNMIAMSRNLDAVLKELTLANTKLQDEVEERKRSEQLRKELIANISHELKTPLGIIKGFAEGLQDGVARDKEERYLALIVNETDRMNTLIMDMLELSKYEAKAIKLNIGSLSLTRLIRKAVDSFSGQLDMRQIFVNLNADEEVAVQADYRRIEQVVLNLLSNAIRHAAENSVISIHVKRTSPGILTTVIENVGQPIADEDLNRIWDHFYRAERSRDRKSGGTGLGLAIVKHILELHESQYGVMNTKQGVAFTFTLHESRGEQSHE